ncbi:MAG: hypothetical protein BGO16_09290 [Nitrobacter sp. 62-23]|nr:MAG: hypothetical protein BGO16_09290 [Nitrobacter sp. 62-23]
MAWLDALYEFRGGLGKRDKGRKRLWARRPAGTRLKGLAQATRQNAIVLLFLFVDDLLRHGTELIVPTVTGQQFFHQLSGAMALVYFLLLGES